MYNTWLLSSSFLSLFLFSGINGQEGVPCETPEEQYGICISIYDCSVLLDLLVAKSNDPKVRQFLRSSTCGYTGSVPLVCCPRPKSNNVNPKFLSSTTHNPVSLRTPKARTTLPRTPQCGFGNITNPRVVNGIPAKLGEFPWIVALGYKNSKNQNQPKWLCGGSLITNKHILTAAHCVHNRQDLYVARLGDLDLFSDDDGANPETIPLIDAKIHEEYSPAKFSSDIAILTLERSPKPSTASPICLPLDEPLRSKNLVNLYPAVAGWGSLYFNGPSSSTLQQVVIPILDNKQCERAYVNRSLIDERVLCAGYLAGGKDACQGDSGGPLMHRTSEGDNLRFYQVGIVSYGLRCAEAGYPGVYTRVTAFLDWIEKNLN